MSEMKVTVNADVVRDERADVEGGLATLLNSLKFFAAMTGNELLNNIIVRVEALSKMPWFIDLIILVKKIWLSPSKDLEAKSADLAKVVATMKDAV